MYQNNVPNINIIAHQNLINEIFAAESWQEVYNCVANTFSDPGDQLVFLSMLCTQFASVRRSFFVYLDQLRTKVAEDA